MGVYIRDMEMPVIELEWTIRRGADGKWYAIDTNAETSDGEWHELIPVPDHGRLIDADDIEHISIEWELGDIARIIAPTIIPADPPVMYYPQVPGITPTVIAEEGE